jgi:hypothetical protein
MTSVNHNPQQFYVEPLSIYFKIPKVLYKLFEDDKDTIEQCLDKILRISGMVPIYIDIVKNMAFIHLDQWKRVSPSMLMIQNEIIEKGFCDIVVKNNKKSVDTFIRLKYNTSLKNKNIQLIREWNRKSEAISLISNKLNGVLNNQRENKIIIETLKSDLIYSNSVNIGKDEYILELKHQINLLNTKVSDITQELHHDKDEICILQANLKIQQEIFQEAEDISEEKIKRQRKLIRKLKVKLSEICDPVYHDDV